jgi:hypothetical protein
MDSFSFFEFLYTIISGAVLLFILWTLGKFFSALVLNNKYDKSKISMEVLKSKVNYWGFYDVFKGREIMALLLAVFFAAIFTGIFNTIGLANNFTISTAIWFALFLVWSALLLHTVW